MNEDSAAANILAYAVQRADPLEAAISYALAETFELASGPDAEIKSVFAESWKTLPESSRALIREQLTAAHNTGVPYQALYESLLGPRTERSRAAAQSGTDSRLNKLVSTIVRPASTVLDPACGLGGTLLEFTDAQTLVGYDVDPKAAALAQMRLLLAGASAARVEPRDALLHPPADSWDLVVSHPPLNLRLDAEEVDETVAANLPGGTVDGNAAWLKVISDSIAPSGQAVIVVSPASLSDLRQITLVREQIVADGKLEAIVALPSGLLPGSQSAAFLWVMAGQRDPRKRGRVLLVDGDDLDSAGQIVKTWVDDAVLHPTHAWTAQLVNAQTLLEQGFAPQIHLDDRPSPPAQRPQSSGRLVTELHLENFKSISGARSVPLRPLTLLFGENSAGKSTLIQSLLLLRQSVAAGSFKAAGSFTDLGSMQGLIHGHNIELPLGLGVSFVSSPDIDSSRLLPNPRLTRTLTFQFTGTGGDAPVSATVGLGDALFTFARKGPNYTLPVKDFKRAVGLLGDAVFPPRDAEMTEMETTALANLSEEAFPNVLFSADGILVGPVEKLFRDRAERRISGSSVSAWGSRMLLETGALTGSLGDELIGLLNRMVYLGPLRQAPERFSRRHSSGPSHDTPFFLLNHGSERDAVSEALQKLGIHYTLDVVNPIARKQRDVLGDVASIVLTDTRSGVQVTPADVGFGISQVLPIVTELSSRTNSLIMIEQPEIHLHPRMQAELADLLIESTDATGRANQVIAETHSETMVLRLQRRVREQAISASDILILYVGQDPTGAATIRELRLDDNGEFLDHWPGGFFDEQFNEMFEGL